MLRRAMSGSTAVSILSMALLAPTFSPSAEYQRSSYSEDACEGACHCNVDGLEHILTASLRSSTYSVVPWWTAVIAVLGAIEVAAALALLVKYVHPLTAYRRWLGERENPQGEISTLGAKEVSESEEADSNALRREVKQLIAEKSALKNAVDAMWQSGNVDIWDLDVQHIHHKDCVGTSDRWEIMSDKESTDGGAQVSSQSFFSKGSTMTLCALRTSDCVSWDWPLSREEKKSRVLLIDQHLQEIDHSVVFRTRQESASTCHGCSGGNSCRVSFDSDALRTCDDDISYSGI